MMASIAIHRRGQLKYRFRAGGRNFARSVADIINKRQRVGASVFPHEEAFGRSDRIHWLIHLRDLSANDSLIDMRAAMTPEVAEVYSRQGISQGRGRRGLEPHVPRRDARGRGAHPHRSAREYVRQEDP